MTAPTAYLDAAQATEVLRRHMNPSLSVRAVRRLHHGPVNSVYEWELDGDGGTLVAKVSGRSHDPTLEREFAAHEWYREHTRVPVPKPYICLNDFADGAATCLIMQRVPGRNLADARLSAVGRRSIQEQLARCVVELHKHQRDSYGNALSGSTYKRWLDRFGPSMKESFDAVCEHFTARTKWVITELIDHLDRFLPESNQPSLIHGDLWANNIIVDDSYQDRPVLTGLVDGQVTFSEPEYELAYLRVFRTVDATFFGTYHRSIPSRPGFDLRCRVYWLHTAMLHADRFDRGYLETCEKLADGFTQYFR